MLQFWGVPPPLFYHTPLSRYWEKGQCIGGRRVRKGGGGLMGELGGGGGAGRGELFDGRLRHSVGGMSLVGVK